RTAQSVIDVRRTVRVARDELLGGPEEDMRAPRGGALVKRVDRAVAARWPGRDEAGRAAGAIVDVDRRIRVIARERFRSLEEDVAAVGARAAVGGIERAVAAGRPGRDECGRAAGAVVDVGGPVRVARDEVLAGFEEDVRTVQGISPIDG